MEEEVRCKILPDPWLLGEELGQLNLSRGCFSPMGGGHPEGTLGQVQGYSTLPLPSPKPLCFRGKLWSGYA